MADVTIDPRYLTYDKDEVQRILDSVAVVDSTPKDESEYPVSSGGVKAELDKRPTNEELDEKLSVSTEARVRSIVTDYTPTAEEGPAEGE